MAALTSSPGHVLKHDREFKRFKGAYPSEFLFFKAGGKVDEWWKSLDFHHEKTKPSVLKKGLLFWVPSRQRPKSAGHPAYHFCARKLASRKQRRLRIELVPPGDDTST